MKFIKNLLLIALFSSTAAYAELDTSYFQLGNWKLGETQKLLLSEVSPFKNVEVMVKNKQYKANVDSIFSKNTPANIYFNNGKLQRLELTIYEGPDYNKASAAAKLIISTLTKQFDGAFLESLTTSEGLKPETFDVVVGQLLEKSKTAMSEINADDGNESYFNLFISLSTEHESKGNFIYGKFSYFGHSDLYNVTIFEDKKFNNKHVSPTMIYIGSKKNATK